LSLLEKVKTVRNGSICRMKIFPVLADKFLDNIPALKSAKEVFFSNVVKSEKQRKVKPYISSVKM
jgi:hypothetical protein